MLRVFSFGLAITLLCIFSFEDRSGQNTPPSTLGTIGVRYVSKGGQDTNDGLSWGTSKGTIYGALVSLPGGGAKIAGSGTVYVGSNSIANPVPGGGIWLMAANDPNYSNPPPGWLKCTAGSCNLNITGMGDQATGPNGHRPRVPLAAGSSLDSNHPGIWIS